MDLNGDGHVNVEDLHWLHANPFGVDVNGEADASDRGYIDAWLRAGEMSDMTGTQRN